VLWNILKVGRQMPLYHLLITPNLAILKVGRQMPTLPPFNYTQFGIFRPTFHIKTGPKRVDCERNHPLVSEEGLRSSVEEKGQVIQTSYICTFRMLVVHFRVTTLCIVY